MRIAAAVFAATMVGLGLWGLANRDFAAIWQPVPKSWPAREALVWASGLSRWRVDWASSGGARRRRRPAC